MFIIVLNTGVLIAEEINIEDNNYEIKYEKHIKKWSVFNIDLSVLKKDLEKIHESKILFEWNIPWENTKNWAIFKKEFEKFWNYEISLSIYKLSWKNKELIINKKIKTFVYNNKITQIFDKNLESKIDTFIVNAKDSWIYIESIILEKRKIEKISFTDFNLDTSKYLVIWGEKEFIFDILSKINSEKYEFPLNLVLISPFNINILQKYIWNFTSNKKWINDAVLIDESSKYEILKQPSDMNALKQSMLKNNYEYVGLNSKEEISEILFISKFINNLSNNWISSINIYLILIIPFLLIGVIVSKHLIGLSTIGILIPVFITLLILKLSLIPTIALILIFLSTNLLLSKLIARYNLHYTPRLVLITIINIIVTIIATNIFISYNLITLSTNDIMFVMLFILVSERFINVIISKDFSEYKLALLNTLLFAIVFYIFFSLGITKTFILSYPEIILLLIPISFIVWKFTWLRVTEYFRFREVIKSIEE
jgi:hypothetical protein